MVGKNGMGSGSAGYWRVAVVLVAVTFAFGPSAFALTARDRLGALLQPPKVKSTASTCTYNLFLTNYLETGFNGATVSVAADNSEIDGFSLPGVTLPVYVEASGWTIPVTEGTTLSIRYISGSSNTGNGLYVTDVNGKKVLTMDSLDDGIYTVGEVSCSCTYLQESECPSYRSRNEWRSMTYCDQKLFINALNTFRWTTDDAGVNKYEKYIWWHENITEYVLERSLFLPWHRGFIWQLENELRALGGDYSCVTLPYWDWSLDFGRENRSAVFDDFGGLATYSCISEPFADWTDPIPLTDFLTNCVYRRVYGDGQTFAQFASISALDLGTVAASNYTTIFKYLVRDPHKSVHVYVAGNMGTLHSPADPLFFLHHANIDRIYAAWQDCFEYDKADQYAQYESIGLIETPVTYTMPDFYPGMSYTIGDMFDIDKFGYRYPPITRNMVRLNKNQTITDVQTCHWDWHDKTTQDNLGLTYRIAVHDDEQRSRLSIPRAAYKAYLEEEPTDYYNAMLAQLSAECTLGGGFTADDFPEEFMERADTDHIVGPGSLFRNACKILADGQIGWLLNN
jgi:tyrosinase